MTGATWADLLAEPARTGPHWLSAVFGRMRWAHDAAGCGPVAARALGDAPAKVDGMTRLGRAWGDGLAPPARPADLDLPEVLGTTAPRLVVVGDVRAADAPLPFYSRSGRWLWEALRLLGWDELGVCVTNARTPGSRARPRARDEALGELADLVAPHAPTWLVLGEEARRVAGALGIEAAFARHPQAHARFQAKEGPAGYAAELTRAGLPAGPWHGRDLPTAPGGAARAAIAQAYAVPEGAAYRPRGRARERRSTVAHAKRAAARRLFVTSQVPTIKAAAEAVGADCARLAAVARDERWTEEREEVTRQMHEAAKSAMIAGEAKRISSACDKAWIACNLALDKLVRQLLAPDARATAADAARLGGLAVLLAGHAPTSDEQRAVADLLVKGPEALAQELLAWAARMRGEAVPPGPGPERSD